MGRGCGGQREDDREGKIVVPAAITWDCSLGKLPSSL